MGERIEVNTSKQVPTPVPAVDAKTPPSKAPKLKPTKMRYTPKKPIDKADLAKDPTSFYNKALLEQRSIPTPQAVDTSPSAVVSPEILKARQYEIVRIQEKNQPLLLGFNKFAYQRADANGQKFDLAKLGGEERYQRYKMRLITSTQAYHEGFRRLEALAKNNNISNADFQKYYGQLQQMATRIGKSLADYEQGKGPTNIPTPKIAIPDPSSVAKATVAAPPPDLTPKQIIQRQKGTYNNIKAQLEVAQSNQSGLLSPIASLWDGVKSHGFSEYNADGTERSRWDPRKWGAQIISYDASSAAVQQQLTASQTTLQKLEATEKKLNQAEELASDPKLVTRYREKFNRQLETVDQLHEKAGDSVEKYRVSQEAAVDIAADIGAGVAAAGMYGVAAAGLVAAPITGGSSLVVTGLALTAATATGALAKPLLKASHDLTGGRSYTTQKLRYDAVTGGFAGLLAPVAAGASNAVIKKVAGTKLVTGLGVNAVEQNLGKTATSQGVKVFGSHMTFEAAEKTLKTQAVRASLWTGREAVQGSVFGTVDAPTRHVLNGGSFAEIPQVAIQGGVMGAILGPVMSGTLHGVGKGIGKLASTGQKFFLKPKVIELPGLPKETPVLKSGEGLLSEDPAERIAMRAKQAESRAEKLKDYESLPPDVAKAKARLDHLNEARSIGSATNRPDPFEIMSLPKEPSPSSNMQAELPVVMTLPEISTGVKVGEPSTQVKSTVVSSSSGSVQPGNDLDRFFVQGFGRDVEWANMMNETVHEAQLKVRASKLNSAKGLLDYIAEKYRNFFKERLIKKSQRILDEEELNERVRKGVPRTTGVYTPIDVTSGSNYNPEGSPYPSALEAALDFLGPKAKQGWKNPLDWNEAFNDLVKGKTMTVEIDGKPVELTKIHQVFDKLQWTHTPVENIPVVLQSVEDIFQSLLKLDPKQMTPQRRQQVIQRIAQMHYRIVHAMPYERGSAGIADAFTKVIFQHFGIETPNWKEGIIVDLKALTMREEDFVAQYGTFFERPLGVDVPMTAGSKTSESLTLSKPTQPHSISPEVLPTDVKHSIKSHEAAMKPSETAVKNTVDTSVKPTPTTTAANAEPPHIIVFDDFGNAHDTGTATEHGVLSHGVMVIAKAEESAGWETLRTTAVTDTASNFTQVKQILQQHAFSQDPIKFIEKQLGMAGDNPSFSYTQLSDLAGFSVTKENLLQAVEAIRTADPKTWIGTDLEPSYQSVSTKLSKLDALFGLDLETRKLPPIDGMNVSFFPSFGYGGLSLSFDELSKALGKPVTPDNVIDLKQEILSWLGKEHPKVITYLEDVRSVNQLGLDQNPDFVMSFAAGNEGASYINPISFLIDPKNPNENMFVVGAFSGYEKLRPVVADYSANNSLVNAWDLGTMGYQPPKGKHVKYSDGKLQVQQGSSLASPGFLVGEIIQRKRNRLSVSKNLPQSVPVKTPLSEVSTGVKSGEPSTQTNLTAVSDPTPKVSVLDALPKEGRVLNSVKTNEAKISNLSEAPVKSSPTTTAANAEPPQIIVFDDFGNKHARASITESGVLSHGAKVVDKALQTAGDEGIRVTAVADEAHDLSQLIQILDPQTFLENKLYMDGDSPRLSYAQLSDLAGFPVTKENLLQALEAIRAVDRITLLDTMTERKLAKQTGLDAAQKFEIRNQLSNDYRFISMKLSGLDHLFGLEPGTKKLQPIDGINVSMFPNFEQGGLEFSFEELSQALGKSVTPDNITSPYLRRDLLSWLAATRPEILAYLQDLVLVNELGLKQNPDFVMTFAAGNYGPEYINLVSLLIDPADPTNNLFMVGATETNGRMPIPVVTDYSANHSLVNAWSDGGLEYFSPKTAYSDGNPQFKEGTSYASPGFLVEEIQRRKQNRLSASERPPSEVLVKTTPPEVSTGFTPVETSKQAKLTAVEPTPVKNTPHEVSSGGKGRAGDNEGSFIKGKTTESGTPLSVKPSAKKPESLTQANSTSVDSMPVSEPTGIQPAKP